LLIRLPTRLRSPTPLPIRPLVPLLIRLPTRPLARPPIPPLIPLLSRPPIPPPTHQPSPPRQRPPIHPPQLTPPPTRQPTLPPTLLPARPQIQQLQQPHLATASRSPLAGIAPAISRWRSWCSLMTATPCLGSPSPAMSSREALLRTTPSPR